MSTHIIRISLRCIVSLLALISCLCRPAAALDQPILLFPPNGAEFQTPGSITFIWNKVPGAESYVIAVSLGTEIRAQHTVPGELNSKIIVFNFTQEDYGKTFTWTVKAIQGEIATVSNPYSFRPLQSNPSPTPARTPAGTPTPFTPPTPTSTPNLPAPELLTPLDGEIIDESQALIGIRFSWKNVTGASGYRLRIYEDNDFLILRDTTETEITYSIDKPVKQIYEWDVHAIGFNTSGASSERRSFVVGTEFYPTPTVAPIIADLDQSNSITAQDVYRFAARYRSKVEHPNFNDPTDLLIFMERFKASANP